MSALQDILDKMYVEEELLAQLDEEQKHILFIKMREEQIRRWKKRETELEERNEPPKPRDGRRVQWLQGKDGDVWVWIMGDHQNDKSIDDIIETETRQKARVLAEEELIREKMNNDVEISDNDEEQLKQQLRQMRLGTSSEESNSSRSNKQIESYNPKSTVNTVPYYSQVFQQETNSDASSFDSNGQNSFEEVEANNENTKKPLIQKLFGRNNIFNDRNQSDSNKSSPVPWRANKRSESPVKPLKISPPSVQKNDSNGNFKTENISAGTTSNQLPSDSHLIRSYNQPSINGNGINQEVKQRKNIIRPPPPVPHKPSHLAKKPKEKGFVQAIRSYVPGSNPTTTYNNQNGPSPFPVIDENGTVPNVNLRESARLRQANNRLDEIVQQDEIEKRQSKMLEILMDEHHRLKAEAEREAETEKLAYEERERKAREAEAQIKFIAQRAREQHQNGLRTSSSLLPVLNNTSSTSFRDAVKNITRPPKPRDRSAIIRWYTQVELPIGTGLNAKTREPEPWFHGILSRQEADSLLANRPLGAFLVRVSERIFGYTISYNVGDETGTSKHFLVEKIPEGYQFLGTNQIVHDSLAMLVDYHEARPITLKGKELLLYPIGQQSIQQPDYAELFASQPREIAFGATYRHT